MERTRSHFIRDLIVKILLILLFVFLITLLFPMPNLTPFYNRIFNDNIQIMKDAAEDYFTNERMPEKVGDSSKLTLAQMIDKKLVLPFLDKDGKECDINKSYVKVTKKKTEYELEVHLTCGNESNYIIEPIGCYNFCPDNSCVKEEKVIKTDEETGKVTINKTNPEPTPTPSNTPQYDKDKYKYQYLYTRTLTDVKWNTGDWTDTRQNETTDVKLVDTRTLYTGKKKVTTGETTYKHTKYVYKDNWTYDKDWTFEVKTLTDTVKLADTRTLYTGQKQITTEKTKYKYIKYAYKDNWTYDKDWTFEVKKETDNLKLYDTRTLYTGQKKITTEKTQYKHIKYAYKTTKKETGYQAVKYKENDNVKLKSTRYTLRKTVETTTGGWSDWIKDTTWRTSRPADTSTTQWSDAYNSRTVSTGSGERLIDTSFTSYYQMTNTDTRRYELKTTKEVPCTTNCENGKRTQYVYYVYEKYNNTHTEYQYMYRTYTTKSDRNTDEVVTTNPKPYQDKGYTIVKYEYNYIITEKERYLADTKWTDSKTSPSGYEYANEKKVTKINTYQNLNKWVTTKGGLGEYTYNISTKKQYKYKHNNPTRYVEDIKWLETPTAPAGYIYANEKTITKINSYKNLNKWVTTKGGLGEYTYNVSTTKQYKYKYNNPTKEEVSICTLSQTSPAGYTYKGICSDSKKTTYVDLGNYVTSREELGEYTYDVTQKTQYKYKTRKVTTYTESKWFDTNPGGDWVYANQTRRIKVN